VLRVCSQDCVFDGSVNFFKKVDPSVWGWLFSPMGFVIIPKHILDRASILPE
jgi:hypothetical protein